MTPLKKWVRDLVQRVVKTYYEGPEPPERLAKMAIAFSNAYPHATRAQWVEFCKNFGEECYRAGYIRGFEYVERDPTEWRDDLPPEMVADMIDPSWRWSEAIDLVHNPDAPVQFSYPEKDIERHQVAEVNAMKEDRILRGARKA